jgi:hypothetical protein
MVKNDIFTETCEAPRLLAILKNTLEKCGSNIMFREYYLHERVNTVCTLYSMDKDMYS